MRKKSRYATTARIFQGAGRPYDDGVPNVVFGIAVRNVRFCPLTFNPGPINAGNLHSVPLLASTVAAANYPAGNPAVGPSLDMLVPISGTFYHELYHLTDTLGTTRDPYCMFSSLWCVV